MNALELLNSGSYKLQKQKIKTHRLDSEILLSKVLNKSREQILIRLNQNIKNTEVVEFNNFEYFKLLSIKLIDIPLFRKASSLILLASIEELNFIEEKISFDGKKVILVPLFLVFPDLFNGFNEFPSLKLISYSTPSLKIFNSNFSDSAFTTETPTPCKPPETL